MQANDILFRASAVSNLMTEAQGKSNAEKYADAVNQNEKYQIDLLALKVGTKSHDNKTASIVKVENLINELKPIKDKVELSETTKTYLLEVYALAKYNRRKEITSKFLEKGTLQEEDGITLYSRVTGDLFIKNETNLKNEFCTGTPDILTTPIIDIKCAWDLHTFLKSKYADLNKAYYWQLQCYMWLTGVTSAKLVYCLVDTPDHLIASAKRQYLWNTNQIEDGNPATTEALDEIEYNMRFGDIPEAERVHIIDVAYCPEDIERLKVRIQQCREYMAETFTF